MKRILRSAGALLVCSALLTPAAQAYVTVTGNGTAPATFNVAPINATFFRPTGEYYFGLTDGGGNYALCYTSYRTPNVTPALTALGTDATITALRADYMTVVPNSAAVTSPTIIAAIVANAAATNTGQTLKAISKTALAAVTTAALGDTAAAATGGIRALAAGRSASTGANVVFAAVKASTAVAGRPFGTGTTAATPTLTDGINAALITQTAGTPAFTYIGAAGVNTARAVDLTATGSFLIDDLVVTPLANIAGTTPAFCYDEQLQRVYVGIQATIAASGNAAQRNGLYGVNVYPVTITAGTSVAVGAALVQAGSATDECDVVFGDNYIIGRSQLNAGVSAALGTAILNLKTMHTSTGMAYLIVNGDTIAAGATTTVVPTVSNKVYAVPLVNGTPTATNDVGCFAKVTSGTRTVKAAASGDLVSTGSLAALVGGTGEAPVKRDGTNIVIKDMYVDNDCVYIATGGTAFTAGNTEQGIFKSQAVFNELGQIDHWTDWQKVAPNDMGGTTLPADGSDPRVDFAAVDAYTGHVYATNATSLATQVTQWTQPATTTLNSQQYLAAAVNKALGNTCYSVLDLNISTTGWGDTARNQIALFGGQEKVCFAITGTINALSTDGTYTSVDRTIVNSAYDYSNTLTFVTTSLPSGAGAVTCLGYSGWEGGTGVTVGFFFAGCAGTAATAPGLYVWTPAGTAGFDVTNMGATANSFSSLGLTTAAGAVGAGSWQKIANVSGMPVKMQALGGGFHVLTRTATLDRIYSCPPRQTTAALLNSSFVVTASSGVAPTAGSTNSSLASASHIYDFVVSVSASSGAIPSAGVEQLMMLTNDGIYTTTSAAGMQTPNLSQLNAGWVRLDTPSTSITTLGLFTDYIASPAYNRFPQSFWFANFSANPLETAVYNKNIQYQMSRQSLNGGTLGSSSIFTENPTNTATFDGATSFNQTTAPTIYQNFPVLYRLFYNDGARRFFIQKNPNDDTKYQVLALPYNLYDYNITADGKAVMADTVVAQAGAFYWMSPIGDTGRLMMGTSSGVISLQ